MVPMSNDSGAATTGPLSSELSDPSAVPYFLWADPMTVAELKGRLASASDPERVRLLAAVLREARDSDVWHFTTPDEVARRWSALSRHLGKRRAFWSFLLSVWLRQGKLTVDRIG